MMQISEHRYSFQEVVAVRLRLILIPIVLIGFSLADAERGSCSIR